jgi:GTPase SAR1 family protein
MFCQKEANPTRNHLLEEHILWRDFRQQYDMDNIKSLDTIDFFSYNLILNDLQRRQAHIQSLIDTVSEITTANSYIDKAQHFVRNIRDLRCDMQEHFDALDEQNEDPNELLDDYQQLLSPEDCLLFTETCEEIKKSYTELVSIDHIKSEYKTEEYKSLVAPNNKISASSLSLDLDFRRTLLLQLIQQLENVIPLNHPFTCIYRERIHKATCLVDDLGKLDRRIKTIQSIYDLIELCLLRYYNLLIPGVEDNQCVPLYYSSFVHICEILQRLIEQGTRNRYFPILMKQMNTWNESVGCDDQFQPKLVPFFQAIHDDVDNLHMNRNLPYRVGIVGYRSSGKSSLLNRLRNITNQDDPLFSPVALIKSTYCFLQYTVKYEQCSITYVDIEGYDQEMYFYEQQITRADCDAYIIVSDQTFSRLHLSWKILIEMTLARPCLFVRSKADSLFLDCYPEVTRKKHPYNIETATRNDIKRVLLAMRNIVTKTESNETLEKVYLVAAKYPHVDERIQGMECAEFDLETLRNDLLNMATQPHRYRERFSRMAMSAGAHVINVCFRRGYVVSATSYQIASGVTAVIPFLEKVPEYFAREKIRQVLGVRGGKDTFENYLLALELHVPDNLLKTSVFNYLPHLDNETEVSKRLLITINLLLGQVTTPYQSSTSIQTPLRRTFTFLSDLGGNRLECPCKNVLHEMLPSFRPWKNVLQIKSLWEMVPHMKMSFNLNCCFL